MQVLLDTHAFIWWFSGSDRLPLIVQQAIADDGNDVFVSAASAWEITTKHRLGKIPNVTTLALDISGAIAAQNFRSLPITVDDASRAGTLPGPHRDPFDRMLIAQALAHDLVMVSNESLFDRYGVRRFW